VAKVDSGTGKTIVSGGPGAWLSSQWNFVIFRSDGSAWNPIAITIAPRDDVFTASGTWTKPPLARQIYVEAVLSPEAPEAPLPPPPNARTVTGLFSFLSRPFARTLM